MSALSVELGAPDRQLMQGESKETATRGFLASRQDRTYVGLIPFPTSFSSYNYWSAVSVGPRSLHEAFAHPLSSP